VGVANRAASSVTMARQVYRVDFMKIILLERDGSCAMGWQV